MNHEDQKRFARQVAMQNGVGHGYNVEGHQDELRGKAMPNQTKRESVGTNGYEVKIGESC